LSNFEASKEVEGQGHNVPAHGIATTTLTRCDYVNLNNSSKSQKVKINVKVNRSQQMYANIKLQEKLYIDIVWAIGVILLVLGFF